MLDDLLTIAVLTALVAFSVGITVLMHRRKSAVSVRESAFGEVPSSTPDSDAEAAAAGTEPVAQTVTITFSESDEQHLWDPGETSLLEFMESRGIAVESQCRAGECGSCRTKLLSGEVEYVQEPSINPGRGHCLLCVSVPKSDLTLAR